MDIFDFAAEQFPAMVTRKFEELKKEDENATYERAFRAVAEENPDFYATFTRAVGGGI